MKRHVKSRTWSVKVTFRGKIEYFISYIIKSNPPSAAYMRQWTGSALVRVMTCRLFGAKPLPEQMLAYCQLNSWEELSVKLELYNSIQENAFEIVVRQNGGTLVQGRQVTETAI